MDFARNSGLTSARKDELMEQMQQELAVANVHKLLTKITEKCFNICISKPGTSLDNSEQKCVAMCMDRYMESMNRVTNAYSNRIQQEKNKM